MKSPAYLISLVLVILALGCDRPDPEKAEQEKQKQAKSVVAEKPIEIPEFDPPATELENGEMSHIVVQHILIAFKNDERAKTNPGKSTVPGKNITRSRSEAEKLVDEIMEKTKTEDFGSLVKQYTDDAYPGIYRMANFDQPSDTNQRDTLKMVFPRQGMVPVFGDTGFPLKVGEIGLGKYDPEKSKYGWHIIKRLK